MASKKKTATSAAKARSKVASKTSASKTSASRVAVGKRAVEKTKSKAAAASAKTSSVKKSSAKKTSKEADARKVAAAKAAAAKKAIEMAKAKSAKGKNKVQGKAPVKNERVKVAATKKEPAKQTATKKTSPSRAPEIAKAVAPRAPVVSGGAKAAHPAPVSTLAAKPPEKIAEPVPQKKAQIPAAPVSPVKSVPAAVVAPAPVVAEKPVVVKPAAARPEPKPFVAKPTHRTGFKANEYIVYPAHGVGQIVAIEEQEVAGFKLELFVISFAKDKMTLKVPMPKVIAGAIRKLAEPDTVKKSLDILMGRARIKRTMWSRRAQEYEAKINSGDLGSIAEVVRDLYRSDAQPEQSYSERQLYEAALDRMAREIAAVHRIIEAEALKMIEGNLLKGPKRGAKTEPTDAVVEADIEQAA